jgi:hypothetical protein
VRGSEMDALSLAEGALSELVGQRPGVKEAVI